MHLFKSTINMAATSVTGMAFVDRFRDRRLSDAFGFLAFAGAAATVGLLGARVLLSSRGHASRAERSSMIVRSISPTEFYSGCAAIFIGVTCGAVWAGEFVMRCYSLHSLRAFPQPVKPCPFNANSARQAGASQASGSSGA